MKQIFGNVRHDGSLDLAIEKLRRLP